MDFGRLQGYSTSLRLNNLEHIIEPVMLFQPWNFNPWSQSYYDAFWLVLDWIHSDFKRSFPYHSGASMEMRKKHGVLIVPNIFLTFSELETKKTECPNEGFFKTPRTKEANFEADKKILEIEKI